MPGQICKYTTVLTHSYLSIFTPAFHRNVGSTAEKTLTTMSTGSLRQPQKDLPVELIWLTTRFFGFLFFLCVLIHIPNIVAEEMQLFELVSSLFLQLEDTYHECHLEIDFCQISGKQTLPPWISQNCNFGLFLLLVFLL